jgi:hypothetical protein
MGLVAGMVAIVSDASELDQPELMTPVEARALADALNKRADEIDAWAPYLRRPGTEGGIPLAAP